MKNRITLLLACLGIAGAYAQTNCANALTIGTGQHGVTYANGSEIPSVNCISPTTNGTPKAAWYKYIPTEDFNTTISSYIPAMPTYDTYVQVFEGSCGSLVCAGVDDNSGPNLTSILTFMAEAGTTYYIVFENRFNSSNFTFSLTEAPYIPPMFEASPVGIAAMAIVDMNGDYLDDLVSPGNNVVNILQQNADGSGFTSANRTALSTMYMPSWSIAAGDYNKDGYNDLLYGNGSGAAIMISNNDGSAFTSIIETQVYVFSQRTNFVDINADGNLDAFICHDVQPNVYFLNDGEGGYEFHNQGLGEYPSGGNYGSIWIDFDNDSDIDLFIAKCRGGGDQAGINEMHRNDGNGDFTQIAGAANPENNMSDIIQTWSSAWADYDNDGDMDVLVGASSAAQGYHKLMVNDGSGNFTNETAGSGYDTFTALNIEHIAHDFNNDGWVDVFGGGQTIMLNNGDMTFTPFSVPMTPGPVGDLNNDGFLDVENNSTIYYNTTNDNNWVKVTLEGVESNSNGIGARVTVYAEGDGWEKQIRDVRSGDGFRYMSTLNAHFGLGTTSEIEKIVVKWPSGTEDTILNPDINGTVHFREGDNVLATPEVVANTFTVYPNPVKDMLTITGNENITAVQVYDLAGRLVKSADVLNNQVSLQSLAKGTYIVKFKNASGAAYSSKIVKE